MSPELVLALAHLDRIIRTTLPPSQARALALREVDMIETVLTLATTTQAA